MRLALLTAVTTAAGLGGCAPLPPASPSPYSYGYTAPPAPAYGYYDGAYAPVPYYAEPGYAAPYVAPGPTIIVGGERRWNDRDRDRYRPEPPRFDGGYRGGPPPGRDFDRRPAPQNFGGGGGRPGPSPVAMSPPPRPAAPSPPGPGAPPPHMGHDPSFNPANPTAQGGADR